MRLTLAAICLLGLLSGCSQASRTSPSVTPRPPSSYAARILVTGKPLLPDTRVSQDVDGVVGADARGCVGVWSGGHHTLVVFGDGVIEGDHVRVDSRVEAGTATGPVLIPLGRPFVDQSGRPARAVQATWREVIRGLTGGRAECRPASDDEHVLLLTEFDRIAYTDDAVDHPD